MSKVVKTPNSIVIVDEVCHNGVCDETTSLTPNIQKTGDNKEIRANISTMDAPTEDLIEAFSTIILHFV